MEVAEYCDCRTRASRGVRHPAKRVKKKKKVKKEKKDKKDKTHKKKNKKDKKDKYNKDSEVKVEVKSEDSGSCESQ